MVNLLLERIYETKRCEDGDGNLVDPFHASIPWRDGMVLYETIRQTNSTRTLETGMAYGLSTLFMCQAVADNGGGIHVAIDPAMNKAYKSIGVLNVKRAGFVDMVRCYEAPSHEVLPKLLAQDAQFDFVFIDGFHAFDTALLDFYYADRLIPCGGRILFHDVWMPSIRKALSSVLRNRDYRVDNRFNCQRIPFRRWLVRSLKSLFQNPFDPYASTFLRQDYAMCNFVLVEKIADDTRTWTHYSSF